MSENDTSLPRLYVEDDVERSNETRLLEPQRLLDGRPRAPWFIVVSGPRSSGRMFAVRTGMTIGRAIGSEILIDEDSVSRRHAKVKVLATGQVLVEDLLSSNGLYVGGARVPRVIMKDGDRVGIGDVVLSLLLLDVADPSLAKRVEVIDAATRLPNRRHVADMLRESIEYVHQYDSTVAFCLLQIDQLCEIHDAHGAEASNAAVSHVAAIARNVLQNAEACVARHSEDEIAIIIPDMDDELGARCAEWIRRAVEASEVAVGKARLKVTVSGGVVAVTPGPAGQPCPAAVVERARQQLCRAILGGRNCIVPRSPLSSSRPSPPRVGA